jgi:hypothetical protein
MDSSERDRVRQLAADLREIVERGEPERNKQLWRDVNDLRMTSPVVLVRSVPRALLEETTDELTVSCRDPLLREIESNLLLQLYEWKHLRGHMVIEPFYRSPLVITDSGFGLPITAGRTENQTAGRYDGSVDFEPVIRQPADIDKLLAPLVTYDELASRHKFDRTCEILDGILETRLHGVTHFKFNLWDNIFSWTGIEEGLFSLVDHPDFMHSIAGRFIELNMDCARRYEELGILSSNNSNVLVGQEGYGYCSMLPDPPHTGIGCGLADIWGSAQDQIFTSVSPAMTREYAFGHELAWAGLYGRFAYGCCERLDNKIKELGCFPNLGKISISPYSNARAAMEQIGPDCVVSYKPNSNYLASSPWARDILEKELRSVCRWARDYGCNLEIIIKTIISLDGDPQRLWEWTRLASDIAGS